MCEIHQEKLISCQLSFYPLGRKDYRTPIDDVITLIRSSGLKHSIGEASTLIYGTPGQVFTLLHLITEKMDESECQYVMPASISNACGLE